MWLRGKRSRGNRKRSRGNRKRSRGNRKRSRGIDVVEYGGYME
jgi:hypothetical protein